MPSQINLTSQTIHRTRLPLEPESLTAHFGTASDLYNSAQLRKILDDNGAPQTDLQFVMGSAAIANLRGKQTILLRVNAAGFSGFAPSGHHKF